ncbi:MAG: sugar ABC transporter permease [Thermotogaceae bacterium]|nr:sugar ABC transporter permease [Thermotogaceae bacterium]
MKTQGKLWTVCIVAIVTIIFGSWAWYHSASSAWMSTVTQNEKNAILYAENSLQLMMAQSNGHLNRTIETLAMHSVDLAQEMVDLIASDFGDTCLYVCLYDFDGKRIAAKGENIPEGFENSSFFETMRYSDGRALSESSLHSGTLHIQTASLLADGSAVLVGQDILPFYLTGLKSILGRDFWFYYGNDEQFDSVSVPPVSEPVYPKDYEEKFRHLFQIATDSQRPAATLLPYQGSTAMFTAIALYDAEHWDVKGFLVQITPKSFWQAGSDRISWFVWIGSLLSCIVASVFLSLIHRKRASDTAIRVKKKYVVYAVCAFAPVLVGILYGSFLFVPSLLKEYESKSAFTSGRVLFQDLSSVFDKARQDPKEVIEEMKRRTRDEYRVLPAGNQSDTVSVTTLSTRLSRLVSPLRRTGFTEDIEVGKAEIDRIGFTYTRLVAHGFEWQVFREETFMNNEILSVQFLGAILFFAFLVVTLVFGFLVYHLQDRLLVRNTFLGYLFLAPALVHLIWWAAGPLGFSLFLAFRRWSVVDPAKPFVGLDNFIELFQDGNFWNALKNTAVYSLYVPIGMLFSLLLAMAVNRAGKVAIALRVLYYLPVVTAGVATTIVWRWIFNRDFGILNYILGWFGIGKIAWLDSPQFALLSIMIISIWQAIGSQLLIFLAGLQGIPIDFYDAAKVDGAGKYKVFRHITLPLLKPTTLFVLVTSIIGSFQVFTPVYVLTQGGPLRSTDVVFYHIWKAAWTEMRMGYAAAQSWILFLLLMVLTYFEFKLYGKDSWQAYF